MLTALDEPDDMFVVWRDLMSFIDLLLKPYDILFDMNAFPI